MTNPNDAFRQAAESDDGTYPEAWIPDVGDLLIGEITDYSEGSTKHGTYKIVVIHDEDGDKPRAVWLVHKVLENEFRKHQPKIGERVSIKRHEDGCTATGTEYHRYRVRVDRPAAAAPDFDKFTRADDIPPADVRQAIEETREAVESKPVAEPASHTESFADFPEALGDDPDDDLPF